MPYWPPRCPCTSQNKISESTRKRHGTLEVPRERQQSNGPVNDHVERGGDFCGQQVSAGDHTAGSKRRLQLCHPVGPQHQHQHRRRVQGHVWLTAPKYHLVHWWWRQRARLKFLQRQNSTRWHCHVINSLRSGPADVSPASSSSHQQFSTQYN